MKSTQDYIAKIKEALNYSLCLREFPHEQVEKHYKPEIEVYSMDQSNKLVVQEPIYIAQNEIEKCLIEPSINSCRISLHLKELDYFDKLLNDKFSKFLTARAELFQIIRKVPIEVIFKIQGYNFSFLITYSHMLEYQKQSIIDFITDVIFSNQLILSIDKELSYIKLNIISQTRSAGLNFVKTISNQ